jgi:UDP-N-acetylglucosamine 3-dehydrogenase
MATPLRFGLLGLGMMGRNHARLLRDLDGVELVAVADPMGDPKGYAPGFDVLASAQELVDAGIDACVVAIPTAFHKEVALELAAAGVHALVEKPLAPTSTDSQVIVEAFESAGLVGCVGHIERYNPSLVELRKRLEDGELGDIYQISTRRQGPFPNRIADVGVVMDLATHDIDLTAWVTERPYVTVAAQAQHKSGREHEDLVAVVAQLEGGTVANHLVNWLSPMKERLTVVTGERGCYVANTLAADLTLYENGLVPTTWDHVSSFRGVSEGDMTRFAIPKPEPLRVELEQFRDAVLGLDATVISMRDGLSAVRVAEACIASARTGSTVAIDERAAEVVGR